MENTDSKAPTTYFRGDLAVYTGNTMFLYGALFYEIKMAEGHLKDQIKVVRYPPCAVLATPMSTLSEARAIYKTSTWDKQTVSIHLPLDVALQLMDQRRWRKDRRSRWVSPDAQFACWELDEALALALTADTELD